MNRRTKKTETPDQVLERWIAGQVTVSYQRQQQIRDEFEPGTTGYITLPDGMCYERFDLEDGGYVVVEWSKDQGTVGVC